MLAREKINGRWHAAHRMPENPTRAQRVEWHLQHSEECDCRPVPESLKEEVAALRAARDRHRAN